LKSKFWYRSFVTNVGLSNPRFALNGSFTIFLFLGDPCEDPTTWHHDRNMIGSDGIFASATRQHCANCREQHEHRLLDADTIPLTTPLISYWRSQEELNGLTLKSLYPPDVVPFLKWNLHWRITDVSYRRPKGV